MICCNTIGELSHSNARHSPSVPSLFLLPSLSFLSFFLSLSLSHRASLTLFDYPSLAPNHCSSLVIFVSPAIYLDTDQF